MTGPARLRISAGPGRTVTAHDFCGPGRYGPRFQLGRAVQSDPVQPEDFQHWSRGPKKIPKIENNQ